MQKGSRGLFGTFSFSSAQGARNLAWLSCLWALTNNVQKRKEERQEKEGFSYFIIALSFLVQFTQDKLQYVQKIHCYNYMYNSFFNLLIQGQILLSYTIFHLYFCMVY